MGGLFVNFCDSGVAWLWYNYCVQEGDRFISIWVFCCKLDVRVSGVNVIQKLVMFVAFCIAKVSSVYLLLSARGLDAVLRALVSHSSKQVGYN